MNDLSWLLYFAEVLPKLGSFAQTCSIGSFLLGSVIIGVWAINYYDSDNRNELSRPWYGTWILSVLFFSFIWVFTPSQQTVIMIAASEAGEAVVTSDTGKEILSDIHEALKFQIENLKSKKVNP